MRLAEAGALREVAVIGTKETIGTGETDRVPVRNQQITGIGLALWTGTRLLGVMESYPSG